MQTRPDPGKAESAYAAQQSRKRACAKERVSRRSLPGVGATELKFNSGFPKSEQPG